MTPITRVMFVVNSNQGIQVRRARSLSRLLRSDFGTAVLVAPGPRELRASLRGDIVYVIDPGKRGFPAAVAAWLRGCEVVVEIGDPQAALYRAQGRGPLAVIVGAGIDWIVAHTAAIVVVRGRGAADEVGVSVPWVEIPDGVDPDVFRPGLDGELRRELGIPHEALVVGLVGSLEWSELTGTAYGWDIVEALSHLRDQPVWALIVGAGSGRARLMSRASELRLADRVQFPGNVPHVDVPRYICAMDVCVSTQSNDAIGRSRTTAKLPEYLACDRYVLATAVGGAADVLPDEMLMPFEGVRDANHPRRLATRLTELLPRQAWLRAGVGTRSIALERYSYAALAQTLSGVLQRLPG